MAEYDVIVIGSGGPYIRLKQAHNQHRYGHKQARQWAGHTDIK